MSEDDFERGQRRRRERFDAIKRADQTDFSTEDISRRRRGFVDQMPPLEAQAHGNAMPRPPLPARVGARTDENVMSESELHVVKTLRQCLSCKEHVMPVMGGYRCFACGIKFVVSDPPYWKRG